MNFEEESNQYLLSLINNGIFITGDLIGVNETLQTSIAKIGHVFNDEVSEKKIIIFRNNDVLSWKFYNISDNFLTYDYSTDNWNYPQLSKRIIAPINLALDYPQFEVWFRINGLPIVKINNTLYCYCNEILPEHQTLVDNLQGQITIENRP